jgi:ATP synthase protein I
LGESNVAEESREVSSTLGKGTHHQSSNQMFADSVGEYVLLQRRIFILHLVVSALAGCMAAIFFNFTVAFSLLVGALSGLLYLRLLSRSIGHLGKTTSGVSKVQLIVPVVLFLAVSRLPQLQLLPSLLGFFLYKPSLMLQFVLDF